jgi:uncharacterized protein YndB with AHSA1/START domain
MATRKTAVRGKPLSGIGADAVKKATGKTWSEWFTILDGAGATEMPHADIARHIYETHGCSGWWSRMVAVAYEQARGPRKKHERPDGFQISLSKTIAAPVHIAFHAWNDPASRENWLTDAPLTIHKATENKSLRITWTDGKKSVEVRFYPKGEDKTQVVVQHSRLPSATASDRMKAYWTAALSRLSASLTR